MTAFYTWVVEMYLDGAWVDISADVRSVAPLSFDRGIDGSNVTDRVAKVGALSLTLNNAETNSAGLLGYYSPDNANVRSGFGLGTKVHWIIDSVVRTAILDEDSDEILDEDGFALTDEGGTGEFYGKISGLTPLFGEYKERYVSVQCVDYMNELLVHNMNKVAVQMGQKSDQLLATVVGNLPTAPLATSYATGVDTLAYALHDVQDERTSAMNAVQRIDQSGLSYTFVAGDVTGGECLTHHSRNTRVGLSSVATFDNSMTGLTVTRKADGIYNNLKATGYPLNLGTGYEILWASQKEIVIGPGQTMVVEARYTDPSGAGKRVALIPGTNLCVKDTDYSMSSVSGSGTNKSTALTIVITWGGNLASISLTNTDAATCYIWLLRLRGKIIRLYDPLVVTSTDPASQAAHGDRGLSIAFPYQDNIHAIQAFSSGLLNRLKDPHTSIDSLEFIANVDDATLAKALACDVGRRITISETVTGFDAQDYVIGTYELAQTAGKLVCKLGNLERSSVWSDIGTWEETPAPGEAASYDAVSDVSSGGGTGTSASGTHTPVGTPSLIVVGLVIYSTQYSLTPTATYGGVAMNLLSNECNYIGSNYMYLVYFYLFAPPAGAQTVTASWASARQYKMSCVSILNAATLNAWATAEAIGGAKHSTVDVAGKANGIVVGYVAGWNLGADTIGADQTEFTDDQDENPDILGCYETPTTDSTRTVSYDYAGTGETIRWITTAASFYTA